MREPGAGALREGAVAALLTLGVTAALLLAAPPTGAATGSRAALASVLAAAAAIAAAAVGLTARAVLAGALAAALVAAGRGALEAEIVAPLVAVLGAGVAGLRTRPLAVALGGAAVAAVGHALLVDPYLDAGCLRCASSPYAIAHAPDAAAAIGAGGALLAAGAVLVGARAAGRRGLVLVAFAGLAAVAPWWSSAPLVALAACACLAVDAGRAARARRRLRGLLDALRDAPDPRAALREGVGDPTLDLVYVAGDGSGPIGADGGPPPRPLPHQRTTELRAGGTVVAQVLHRSGDGDLEWLAAALDAPARLALENARLTAELAHARATIQGSRRRIVERGDAERRRLERDVHDGAQQHVLALGFDLRLALGEVAAHDPARPALERGVAETRRMLDELRAVAHGIYPPSLDTGGLLPALRVHVQDVDAAVDLGGVPDERYPAVVERTAFALVAEAVAHGGLLAVAVERVGDDAAVTVRGARGGLSTAVSDRIAALGGRLASADGTISAVLPCA